MLRSRKMRGLEQKRGYFVLKSRKMRGSEQKVGCFVLTPKGVFRKK